MNSTEWKTNINESFNEVNSLPRAPTRDHPLKNVVVTERIPRRILGSQPSTGRTTPTPVSTPSSIVEPLTQALQALDPLTEFALQEMDPLSQMVADMENKSYKPIEEKTEKIVPYMQPWSARKKQILSKFTTSEKISIVTSFLSDGDKVIVKAQSTAVDKVQHRLEQLDYFEEGSQRKYDLSQAEYVSRIEQLNRELVLAWNSDQRVKSLKIAIQCAKLLADTDVLSFYPSKFVLVTDILDIFGKLVYDRLRNKSEFYKPGAKTATPLPEQFTPEMVPETAKETCLNWFYKIASIRELVPRMYVEIALLKSYNFISTSHCPEALLRISDMTQGIGNPLVAVYARCYLCRVGLSVTPINSNSDYLKRNFTGFLDAYNHLFSRGVKIELSKQQTDVSMYMTLYTPALDFILEAVAFTSSEAVINELLDRSYRLGNSSLILNTIMSAFKPAHIADRALQLLNMMSECTDDGIPLYMLLRTLGLCISVCPPPSEQRRPILNIVWKHISSIYIPQEYILCSEAWVQFVAQYFSNREINSILGDIIEHMLPNRSHEAYYSQLKQILEKIVTHTNDFELLLVMDNFLPFIDLFQQESIRVEVCKTVLSFCNSEHKTNDPVITNALMFLCSVLHDSVDALTPEDEYKQIGEILCNIVRRVDYGLDFEQQLSFYVEARAAFTNIDVVMVQLVQCVNSLSVKTRQIVKGLHTRKTGDFVRACAAYCFITIPSIISVKSRLELYLLSGKVALFNQCLGQADACLRAVIVTISELQDDYGKSEAFLVSFVKQFLSTLVLVPDHPELGVLSPLRNLLNVVRTYQWVKGNGSVISIYISVINMLCIMAQEEYPYHIEKVESNDALYGSDPKFISEINKLCTIIVGEVLAQLKELGPCKRQTQLAAELFTTVMCRGEVSSPHLSTLALNLWTLIFKTGFADKKYMIRIKESMTTKNMKRNNEFDGLLEKIKVS